MKKDNQELLLVTGSLAVSAATGFQFGITYGLLVLAVLSVGAVIIAKLNEMKRKKVDEKNPL